ncbi:MAG: hypothetical protein KAX15_04745, partial [Candidatus Omnitrophica bacterium]|nr:hypothetical protein [Candidatus Omnitrophota bacterium]
MELKNQLDEDLNYIKLPQIKQIYEETAVRAAKENLSHIDYLAKLISEEAACKSERSIRARINQARFQRIKTIDSFDFSQNDSIK